jgi:CDGSH-type Zn-finger protein
MSNNNKSMIVPLTNGLLYLINDREPKVVENLVNSKDEKLSNIEGIALCRCGASKNKPFCDGTHSIIGFSSKNNDEDNNDHKNKISSKGKRKSYFGKEITIHDNRKICSHAAECVNNLPSVFRLNQRPWIDPDQATNNKEIIETIRKCPSGALSYSIDGIEYRDYDGEPLVKVSKDGPYFVSGGIELVVGEAEFPEEVSKEHYALCRCGASKNKPFCDGPHSTVNFKDEKN